MGAQVTQAFERMRNLRDQTFRAVEHSADLARKKAMEKLASFIFKCQHRQIKDLPEGSVGLMIRPHRTRLPAGRSADI